MAWPLVIAAVGAASSAYNAYDEYHANKKQIKTLEDIKASIKELKHSINVVQKQNKEILSKLEKLPYIIELLVEKKIDEALLDEKYSIVYSIYEDFVKLKKGKPYMLTSGQWVSFSQSMYYLFENEHRLKNIYQLILVSEISLVITNYRSKPKVIARLDEKIHDITLILSKQEDYLNSSLRQLKTDLDNKKYVKTHNFSPSLESINKLKFIKTPNKSVKKVYEKEECEWHTRHVGNAIEGDVIDVKVCKTVKRTKSVPDKKYHKLRDNHIAKINENVSELKDDIAKYAHLNLLLRTFKHYRKVVSPQSLERLITDTKPLYFIGEDHMKSDVALERVNETDFKKFINSSV